MNDKKARSFVMIMIVIAVIVFALRVIVEQVIKINIAQNESHSSVTLKQISAALENYFKDKGDVYPTSLSVLTQTKPPYLDKDYISKSPLRGYNYSCLRLEPSAYSCSATPASCRFSGNMIYTITTGSLLVSEECARKD